MERFRKGPNEQVLKKGNINYLRGEQTFKAIMFHGASTTCKAFLTSERFVGCHIRQWNMIGGLFFLIALFIPKKIIFEVPLDRLVAINYDDPKLTTQFTLKESDGQEFRISLTGLFDKRETWVDKITEAVKNLRPEVEVQSHENGIEFVLPQAG
jgi:hypothetical protein